MGDEMRKPLERASFGGVFSVITRKCVNQRRITARSAKRTGLIKSAWYFCRDSIGWAIVLNFLVYVTLPVPLRYAGILLGIGSFGAYISSIAILAKRDTFFLQQVN